MIAQSTLTHDLETAKARGSAYALLAAAYRSPDQDLILSFTDPDRWPGIRSIVERRDFEASERLEECRSRWIGSPAACLQDLQDAHIRLFGHAVRGACPLYEMEYGQGEIVQQAPLLADITGFYTAFGLELPPTVHERADHVSVECEFMSVLASKEAWAVEGRNQEAVDVVHDAQARFLEDHLGRWLPALARRIEDADPDGCYGALARFAVSFIADECRRFDIAIGPPLLELRPSDPAVDATITCGVEESCPGGQTEPLVQIGIGRGDALGG